MSIRVRACAIALCALTTTCAPAPRSQPTVVRFTIGAPGRGIEELTDALIHEYRTSFPDLRFEMRRRTPGVSNIAAVERGDADFSFTYADVADPDVTGRCAAG